ncbi:antibiotic biosynthesis monooxygenase [Maribrevibacterium harenarium]|uniref:Antibiotic biosynthesis monooxygenase n=1 Tax=Maribrevibacterium harenarium TaxID=2589817 RepID=A0A501WIX1_9GAMM|nr:antibiotic biosynthesis monooxygenase [Maribrevibacterium harenarium]TPE47087.1 antibiotic biosynthesis monooxygenase [Maribrevibacterium harenarium]
MIQVVYEWSVAPENVIEFREAWDHTTTIVRETYPGAHGSCLLEDKKQGAHMLTIARWNSEEEWRDFWTSDNPPEVMRMSQIANLVSVKVYRETGNHMS